MSWSFWMILGCLYAALSVSIGAFGAHAWKDRLDAAQHTILETAVRYQMYHAFALLFLGLLQTRIEHLGLSLAGWGFALGVALFSGSLYYFLATGERNLMVLTPVGGSLLILAWLTVAMTVLVVTRF